MLYQTPLQKPAKNFLKFKNKTQIFSKIKNKKKILVKFIEENNIFIINFIIQSQQSNRHWQGFMLKP